jgi:gliding motility-associated-like protein
MVMEMKDELIDRLRERFSGHESEVPDGVWENVSGQLAASANGEDLRETLQDKFRAHEVEVDPSVWSNISSQLGRGVAGTSFGGAWIAAGVVTVAITAGLLFWNNGQEAHRSAPVRSTMPEQVVSVQAAPDVAGVPEIAPVIKPAAQKEQPSSKVTSSLHYATKKAQATEKTRPQPTHVATITPVQNEEPRPTQDNGQTAETHIPQPDTKSAAAPGPQESLQDLNTPQQHPSASVPNNTDQGKPMAHDQDGKPTTAGASNNTADVLNDETALIIIPNTFTPNGDGPNEQWKVVTLDWTKADVSVASITTGKVVFHTNDLNEGWNGLLPNGSPANESLYLYVVSVTDHEGHVARRKGTINILR